MQKQKSVLINDVQVPILVEGGEIWYPLSYIFEKVMTIKTSANQLFKLEDIKQLIKRNKVDYGYSTGGIQNTYCINDEGLKKILGNSKIGRLSIEQKRGMNKLLEYLGMELIMEDERFIKTLSKEEIINYTEYIQDCIQDVLEEKGSMIRIILITCATFLPYYIGIFF